MKRISTHIAQITIILIGIILIATAQSHAAGSTVPGMSVSWLSYSTYGQTVTIIVHTWGVSGTPTGIVTFTDGSTLLGSCILDGAGSATFATSSFSVGTHSITVTYSGDATYAVMSLPPELTVNKASTVSTVSSSVNPSVFGQSVAYTATVTAVAPGSGTPTGTVTFMDGATEIGTATLSGGVATFTTSSLATGSHTITASYEGDGNFNGCTGSLTGNPQVVNKADTSTSLVSSVNPSVFGQSVTFTANVAAVAPGSGTPTGSVTFYNGSTQLGTSTLSSGVATFTTSSFSAGTHSITITYSGDGSYSGSTSTALTQTVGQISTNVQLSSSVNPSVFGQSVTFTANVAPVAPGSGTPTGSVNFYNGSTQLGTSTLSGSGVATFDISSISAGTQTITAAYQGDTNYSGSMSTIQQVITKPTPVPYGVPETISMEDLYAHATQTPTPTNSPSSSPSLGATPTATQTPTVTQTPTITPTPLPTQQTTASGLPLWLILVAVGIIAVAAVGYLFLKKQ